MRSCSRIVWATALLLWSSCAGVTLASSGSDNQRLFRQATVQFRQHGEVCVCKDCRELKSLLQARGLLPARTGAKPAVGPLFEGQGIPRAKPAPSPHVPATVPSPPVAVTNSSARPDVAPGAGGRMARVTRGKPLHPFRPIVFPGFPQGGSSVAGAADLRGGAVLGARRVHGVRLADPRPRPVAVLARPNPVPSATPASFLPVDPPVEPVPVASPTALEPRIPSPLPAGGSALPGRPVSGGGLPGVPISPSPGVSGGLPGRPVPVSSGLPGRPIPSTPGVGGLPGRPLPASPGGAGLPGRPIPPR